MSTNRLSVTAARETAQRADVFDLVTDAYWMELESVMRLTTCRLHGGAGRPRVATLVGRLVEDEIAHARRLVRRIVQLGGTVPDVRQTVTKALLPSASGDSVDEVALAVLVLRAAERAVAHYERLAEAARGIDPVTHELARDLLDDEIHHRDAFDPLVTGTPVAA
jgi:ferritin-like protein